MGTNHDAQVDAEVAEVNAVELRCPNCGEKNVGSNDRLLAVAEGGWIKAKDGIEFDPGGYTDVSWDSQESDKNEPCYCRSCTWSGRPDELLEPAQPVRAEAVAMIENALAELFRGDTPDEHGHALAVIRKGLGV